MLSHTGGKPHICKTCDLSFARSSDLERHMGVHTHANRWTCVTCSSEFSSKYGLDRHVRTQHPTGARVYFECQLCNQLYSSVESRKEHMKICDQF
jgi:uncharacterized Zn-finger protein